MSGPDALAVGGVAGAYFRAHGGPVDFHERPQEVLSPRRQYSSASGMTALWRSDGIPVVAAVAHVPGSECRRGGWIGGRGRGRGIGARSLLLRAVRDRRAQPPTVGVRPGLSGAAEAP
ncbi:hypothetical protein GCM10010320_72520 [Streptomyces caelestis]|nr:hypothetical protein GCM10010320_72520 [Streptomyces caelestis]